MPAPIVAQLAREGSVADASAGDDELLSAEAVAGRLGVQTTTVYRWCREGRLPCLKPGKAWRIRRSAFEAFLRRGERRRTLVDHLDAFLTVPDRVVAVAEDAALLERLDAAFFQVGDARGGLLVKFHGGERKPADELRAGFRRNGFDVDRLEAEGRFHWSAAVDPASEHDRGLGRLLADAAADGRAVWASFDWTERVDVATALRQQDELARLVAGGPLVVKSGVLEAAAEAWSPATLRRAQAGQRGLIRLGRDGVVLSRAAPLPRR